MTGLLPSDALTGMRIGMSVSESPDLERLGLLEVHFRLALAEIARCVLVSGGKLAYGGNLTSTGYTTFLISELQKYGRRDRPLLVSLAWQEHRAMSLSSIVAVQEDLGLLGEVVCLDVDGSVVDYREGRKEAPEPVNDADTRMRALTSMRHFMSTRINGRVLLGGKRHGFQGEIPGLMEEALISLQFAQPLFLAGGFGGVTLDIVRALEVDLMEWFPPRPEGHEEDQRLLKGLQRLRANTRDPTFTDAHDILRNGLTGTENRMLAASYRPSHIATLVSLGLGRRATGRGDRL